MLLVLEIQQLSGDDSALRDCLVHWGQYQATRETRGIKGG